MNLLRRYIKLLTTDREAFWFQLWMVYNRYKINTFKSIFKSISRARSQFITVHERPIKAEQINTWSDQLKTTPKIAIVLQGRLINDDDFTLETVKLYKKHFTETIIIISTDIGSDKSLIAKLKEIGAVVVTTERPSVTGIGNINLQLISTLAGLQTAKKMGVEYVYKTRTDQRMYAINISEFLLNLIHTFPVASGYAQKYRIIASSFLSLKFSPYLITDMFQFGHIDDLVLFWSAALDTRGNPEKPIRTVQETMDARIAESYLVTDFLTRVGRQVAWTMADSWDAYANHFCIVDRETLDLFWYKYDFYKEYQVNDYRGVSNSQLLTFAEWLNLYRGLGNKKNIPTSGLLLTRQDYIPTDIRE